jgi:amino-acid N-acetyltransferase
MEIKPLRQIKIPFAKQILKDSDLPFSDIERGNVLLFNLEESGEIIGIGGFEKYDEMALIRSVAVVNEFQGKGYGSKLISGIESEAKKAGIKTLFLLTTTAKEYFEKKGYNVISQQEVPDIIQSTTEFVSLCPVSAVCMSKMI